MSKKKKSVQNFNFYWIYAAIALLFIVLQLFNTISAPLKKINKQKFLTEFLIEGEVEKVTIVNNEFVEVFIKQNKLDQGKHQEIIKNPSRINNGPHYFFNITSGEQFEDDLKDFYKENNQIAVNEQIVPDVDTRKDIFGDIIGWIIPLIIMLGIWIYIMRRMSGGGSTGGTIFNIGKSKAELFDKDTNEKTNFNDVAGLEGAKEEVKEVVDFLKNPKKYTSLGGKIPKGVLLVGPPGTGKTLLAKAVAGEAKVPFFSLSGSDFVEMFVGVGASRVRDLFKTAKSKSPSIVFIDEIDAIGRSRGKNQITGANDERENTLNQLLTEMDGFGTNHHVIVIAATNRADVLDKALVRAGRFDRQIYVDLPEISERKEIFKVHTKNLKITKNLDLDFLAKQTPGFSGADIANLCNESALIAARKNKKQISKEDFLDAVDRIVGGVERKNKLMTLEEREIIAYHESGHAIVSWMLKHAAPLVKVTIVPRGKSLGAAWYLPEERQITRTEQILDEMCATLGGRAAEEIIYNKISTGALSDLEKVSKQAKAMVLIYGFNKTIGNVTYYDSTGEQTFSKPYSEDTAKKIDAEIKKIIEKEYDRAKKILKKYKKSLTELAELLLNKEVIFKEDLEKILGKRKWQAVEKININKLRK
ncbi:MAG: ATP-dependent metallopeptidase FtsH/Yme1/Tma family protein [Flavobacteriales bacterium TMED191]|nr:MAG: ATP-dependent metallopeptidase FtsH/Yme1/Tma family protein [Flavobacteriales bacterium TMED191]